MCVCVWCVNGYVLVVVTVHACACVCVSVCMHIFVCVCLCVCVSQCMFKLCVFLCVNRTGFTFTERVKYKLDTCTLQHTGERSKGRGAI